MLQLCLHHQRKPLREKNWRNRNSNQNIQLLEVVLVEEVIQHFFKRKWERDKSILILETTTWPNRAVVLDEVQFQCWQNLLERSIPHLTVSQLGRVLSYKALTQEEHLPVILLANLCQIQQWLDYCDCCIISSRPEKSTFYSSTALVTILVKKKLEIIFCSREQLSIVCSKQKYNLAVINILKLLFCHPD